MKNIVLLLIISFSTICLADNFPTNTTYKVCFTPSQNCTEIIINELNQAQTEILVQAYSFTSAPIARALLNALERGVDVKVILDKSQYKEKGYSAARFFLNKHIPVWIDYKPAIAHNKIMVIDNKSVITGSFNFTRAAQERNAENVLLITDPTLANLYRKNWMERLQESQKPATKVIHNSRLKQKHHSKPKDEDTLDEIIKYGKKLLKSLGIT